jgi:hypothetical protein
MASDVFEYYPRQGSTPRYVSAARLYAVLRGKLGCVDMGWRERGFWYWITPNGVPFPVSDPALDPDSKAVVGQDGRRQLFFTYTYARDLLARVRSISQMEAPRALRPSPRVQANA